MKVEVNRRRGLRSVACSSGSRIRNPDSEAVSREPSAVGSCAAYVLVLWNPTRQVFRIGRLGRLKFEPGFYLYVGSGGSNALRRIQRHLAPAKRVRWHIDYLTAGRNRMRPVDAYVYPGATECQLALALRCGLEALPRNSHPVATRREAYGVERRASFPGFGSSDCRCPTHLFHAPDVAAAVAAISRTR